LESVCGHTPTNLLPIVTSDFVYLRLIGGRRLAETQFGKLQIDRTEEIRNWAAKIKEIKQNEKDVKVGIVAANNHYRGYGPGTVDIFRKNMDMEKLSFENVNIQKINHQLELENRLTSWKRNEKAKQTTLSDFME
jgi:uncharacterized protein YecE (DUF72 family)